VTVQDVNVLNDSLNENQIEILNNNNVAVPINVQVPIGIAANVCNVAANVLAADLKQDGEADCTATSGSQALGQQILRQKVRQNR
jgi:site-specific recombinase